MTNPNCFPEMLTYQRAIDYSEGYADGRSGATVNAGFAHDDYMDGYNRGADDRRRASQIERILREHGIAQATVTIEVQT